jgi:hypothetical protein
MGSAGSSSATEMLKGPGFMGFAVANGILLSLLPMPSAAWFGEGTEFLLNNQLI